MSSLDARDGAKDRDVNIEIEIDTEENVEKRKKNEKKEQKTRKEQLKLRLDKRGGNFCLYQNGSTDKCKVVKNKINFQSVTDKDENEDEDENSGRENDRDKDRDEYISRLPLQADFTEELSPTQKSKLLIVMLFCCLGNILEWYDFGLFGLLASYIGENFFPSTNKQINIIETFVVWAGSFAMRPVGGILFAHIGDKYSRKLAVYLALICISCGTGLIGCIPSYDQIGITATILMTILRLIQGLAVGGQFVGTMIYVNEHAPLNERACYGSLNFGATLLGALFSNLILIILGLFFTDSQLTDFAWRIPFIGGILFLPFGIWLHNHAPDTTATFDHLELPINSSDEEAVSLIDDVEETQQVEEEVEREEILEEEEESETYVHRQNQNHSQTQSQLQIEQRESHQQDFDAKYKNSNNNNNNNNNKSNNDNKLSNPTNEMLLQMANKNKDKFFLWEVLKHDWGKMLVLISIVGIWSTAYYTMYVWMITYLRDFRPDSPIEDRYNINATWTFFLAVLVPIIGSFTDKFGVVEVMTFGAILSSLSCILGFVMLQYANLEETSNSIYLLWFFQGPMSIAMAFVGASLSTFVSAINYNSPFNYTFLAASYNVAQVLFGGVSPIVATTLVNTFEGYGPVCWVIVCNLLGLVGCAYVFFGNKTLYNNVNKGDGTRTCNRNNIVTLSNVSKKEKIIIDPDFHVDELFQNSTTRSLYKT